MKTKSPAAQLDGFIAKFTPEMAAQIHSVLEKMQARLPGAVQIVYDNYNFFVVGFGPQNGRPRPSSRSLPMLMVCACASSRGPACPIQKSCCAAVATLCEIFVSKAPRCSTVQK